MKEVNPQETTRAYAFEMWLKAPNPMVTFIKTLDITRLVKISRRRRLKFNMLLNWCIGKSAATSQLLKAAGNPIFILIIVIVIIAIVAVVMRRKD